MCCVLYGILGNMQEKLNSTQELPQIIYEDIELLVLNKPAGLVMHGDGRTREDTLVDWLIYNYPEIKEVGEAWQSDNGGVMYRPGIVHRLDRETSGILLVAKTQESYESLKKQFKNREIQKEYRVILNGTFKDDAQSGTIDKPIGKSPSDFRKWSAQPGARGNMREAVTDYEVLNMVGKGNDGYSYVSARPKTGRTHQLRVHFKAVHHPVLGDRLYGANKVHNIGVRVPRTMLHACKINFKSLSGMELTYKAPLPRDFINILDKLELT